MNGAHRESHDAACPLLPRRRRLRPAHPCKPPVSQSLGSLFLLFSPAVFSPCCEAVCHFFSALYFFRAPLPAARFPRGNPAYFFPLEAKRPSAPCFASAVLFPFSSIPACPLSYPVRFPFASPRSLFRLSPQCHPVRRHFSSSRYLPLLALPPFSPIPAVCCPLPLPLGLSRLCFSFPQSCLYRRKKAAKKALPLRKRLPAFGFSRSGQKKPSQREL